MYRLKPLALLLSIFTLLAVAGAQMTEDKTYTNPVVTPVAADPSIIRAPDGSFYLYATQDNWADNGGDHYIPIFKSTDLVNWTFVANAFTWPPTWKIGGGGYWAPEITYQGGKYYLYYAYSTWGDPNPCIGLGISETPEGPFEDLGRAVFCSEDIGVPNSIDAFVWEENGTHTMIWGSFNGIYAVELSEDGTEPAGEPVLLADTRFEAPYIIERNDRYYLFLSAGSCCAGADSTYQVFVGRADKLTGPYLDANGQDLRYGGGTLVLARNEVWIGPGHNAVVTDDAGTDWIVYHAIPANDPTLRNGVNRRPSLIDRIDWVDGWPTVNDGQGPSHSPQPAPVVKNLP